MRGKYSLLRFLECNKMEFDLVVGNMYITLNMCKSGLAQGGKVEPTYFVFDTGAGVTLINHTTFVKHPRLKPRACKSLV